MATPRKIGICIVMIIPTFVFSGLLWQWFHSWFPVIGMIIVMGILCARIIARLSTGQEQEAH
ncbi:MAG: hypothetical protein DRN37_10135 [Thermoplasmata archaeon]|nr:MAG: hypothetical protein DRN37_10135 [Thermoplasmata archaeon]